MNDSMDLCQPATRLRGDSAQGSVARAPERLHLSQPATKSALSRLRNRLKDQLLVRTPYDPDPVRGAVGATVFRALEELQLRAGAGCLFASDGRAQLVVIARLPASACGFRSPLWLSAFRDGSWDVPIAQCSRKALPS